MLSASGADASGGNTRSHPEHDREEPDGRRYYAGDGMGEQAGARIKRISGDVAQLGEHLPCKQGVKSSNLSISIAARYNKVQKAAYCTLKTAYKINIRLDNNCLITRHPRKVIFKSNLEIIDLQIDLSLSSQNVSHSSMPETAELRSVATRNFLHGRIRKRMRRS